MKEDYLCDKLNNKKAMMLMNKNFGDGISDFREFREKECFYIDKSLYIKEILNEKSKTILVTRPRRFGKSLNMSMLYYFFNINEDSEDIFDGLKIMNESDECLSKMNSYPVIMLSFNGISVSTHDSMMKKIKTRIGATFRQHSYLLESTKLNDYEKKVFSLIANNDKLETIDYEIEDVIKLLMEFLYRYFNKRVIVLLDEYDVPLINSYTKGFYNEAIEFFKSFIGTTFKDNYYLEKGVLTGVSRISKEGIFTDANNIEVYTVFDEKFSSCFGFTEKEIREVLTEYELQPFLDGMRKWYDGYTFGNTTDLYNPWSVLHFFKKQKLSAYWINTSSNALIKMILAKSSINVKKSMEHLLAGKEVEVYIDLDTIIPNIEKRERNIWGLLLQAGYLIPTKKIKDNKFLVKLPNLEVKSFFENVIEGWSNNTLNETLNYLINKDFENFEEYFSNLVLEMFSFMDIKEDEDENFYHAFTLGMMVDLKEKYVVLSNRESGLGRYDVCLEPLNKNAPAFIIEFKSCKKKSFEEATLEAKTQIEDKKYETDMRQREINDITKMAIAFKGKDAQIEIFE